MWPPKWQAEENDHLPSPASCRVVVGHSIVVSLIYAKAAVLILISLFNWDPQVLFAELLFH